MTGRSILLYSLGLCCLFAAGILYPHLSKERPFKDAEAVAKHKKFIRLAIDLAQKAADEGNGYPFAAVLVSRKGEVLHIGTNKANVSGNLMMHAEIDLLNQIDQTNPEKYRGAVLYVSTEPSPMCAATIDRMDKFVSKVVFGCSAKRLAFYSQKTRDVLPCKKLFRMLESRIVLEGPVLEQEAQKVHQDYWRKHRTGHPHPHEPLAANATDTIR